MEPTTRSRRPSPGTRIFEKRFGEDMGHSQDVEERLDASIDNSQGPEAVRAGRIEKKEALPWVALPGARSDGDPHKTSVLNER